MIRVKNKKCVGVSARRKPRRFQFLIRSMGTVSAVRDLLYLALSATLMSCRPMNL